MASSFPLALTQAWEVRMPPSSLGLRSNSGLEPPSSCRRCTVSSIAPSRIAMASAALSAGLQPASSCRRCTVSNGPRDGTLVASALSSPESNDDKNRRTPSAKLSIRTLAVAASFGGIAGLIAVLRSTLPPDFERRWRMLLEDAPQAEEFGEGRRQLPTVLYDRHGAVIATIAPGEYRHERDGDTLPGSSGKSSRSVSAAEIPSWLWQAVIASEDRRFFKHRGIDPKGLSRAVLFLGAKGGGSTITQQLVKNVILTNERKWTRKLSEIILAVVLETQMSKWDILYHYLKKIYWGHGVYGIEGAAALYFGKHPSLLTLGECAMLAGIIPSPEMLSPYRDPSRGKKPQARALRRMVETGYLDTRSAVEIMRQPLQLAMDSSNQGSAGPWKAPYFVSEVLCELTRKYGWAKVACGGLQVHTTLDLAMQTVAEKVVRDHLVQYDDERILYAYEVLQKAQDRLKAPQMERQEQMNKVVQAFIEREEIPLTTVSECQEEITAAEQARMEAALVAIDPLSGAVRVLVGGRDYYESSFNRGTEAFRPPGSTFIPVVYLASLAGGVAPDQVLMDAPCTVGGLSPENYDCKLSSQVCEIGRALGIETLVQHEFDLSLTGGCEVTPMQLASVYATIAAGGVHHKPHFITRTESQDGQILEEHKPSEGKQLLPAVSEGAIAELKRALQAVVEKGTGRAARLGRPCGGMPGTSSEHSDIWFAGFTPQISCVVWLGYDDSASLKGLPPVTGASHAAPLWKEFMEAVHEGVPVRKLHDPGSDKHGSRAPRHFVKRSRRVTRTGLHKIRKNHQKKIECSTLWKQVWDWEKASVSWVEQEKMIRWAVLRMRRERSTHLWAGRLQSFARALFAQT